MQHKKPCATCPFTTKCKPGATGGSPTFTYVVQTMLPYWIPCHERIDYSDPNWKETITKDRSTPQCAGAAILRSKLGIAETMPAELVRIDPYPNDRVFRSLPEFFAFHAQIPVGLAAVVLRDGIENMVDAELGRDGTTFFSTKGGA